MRGGMMATSCLPGTELKAQDNTKKAINAFTLLLRVVQLVARGMDLASGAS